MAEASSTPDGHGGDGELAARTTSPTRSKTGPGTAASSLAASESYATAGRGAARGSKSLPGTANRRHFPCRRVYSGA